MAISTETDTRGRLLDAAEKLFAESGVGGTSLRAITAEAGANLASIHYHFGSKDVLLVEVFSRRITPINDARLGQLEEAKADSPGDVDAIVRAFVSPALHQLVSPDPGVRAITQLMGRLYSEPAEIKHKIIRMFEDVARQFTEALSSALPHLDKTEVFWRFHYMVGSMQFTIVSTDIVEARAEGHINLGDVDDNIDRLVRFISGGLSAPGASDRLTNEETHSED
jgi:AcrR family transcriptional regulator